VREPPFEDIVVVAALSLDVRLSFDIFAILVSFPRVATIDHPRCIWCGQALHSLTLYAENSADCSVSGGRLVVRLLTPGEGAKQDGLG
jgi:hypothetical protein